MNCEYYDCHAAASVKVLYWGHDDVIGYYCGKHGKKIMVVKGNPHIMRSI